MQGGELRSPRQRPDLLRMLSSVRDCRSTYVVHPHQTKSAESWISYAYHTSQRTGGTETGESQTLKGISDSLRISIYDHFQQYDFWSTGFIKRESVPTLLFQMMSKVKATSDYAHLRTQTITVQDKRFEVVGFKDFVWFWYYHCAVKQSPSGCSKSNMSPSPPGKSTPGSSTSVTATGTPSTPQESMEWDEDEDEEDGYKDDGVAQNLESLFEAGDEDPEFEAKRDAMKQLGLADDDNDAAMDKDI